MGSGSGLATAGLNPAFLQPTIGAQNFATSGQVTPTSFTLLNGLVGNFPISEKTEVYSLRLDHKLTSNQQLMLRASVSPSYITGIQESAADQNLGENSFSRTATQRFHDVTTAGQYTLVMGPNKVNELRGQFAEHPINFSPSPSPGGGSTAVNIPGFAYFGMRRTFRRSWRGCRAFLRYKRMDWGYRSRLRRESGRRITGTT